MKELAKLTLLSKNLTYHSICNDEFDDDDDVMNAGICTLSDKMNRKIQS